MNWMFVFLITILSLDFIPYFWLIQNLAQNALKKLFDVVFAIEKQNITKT